MLQDPLHLARLAALEGACAALLIAAQHDGSHDRPDGICVEFGPEGLEVTYMQGAFPVSGEGL